MFASGSLDKKVKIWDFMRAGFEIPKDLGGTDELLVHYVLWSSPTRDTKEESTIWAGIRTRWSSEALSKMRIRCSFTNWYILHDLDQ